MKKVLTLLLITVSIAISAKKEKTELEYDKKTGIVTVDGASVFKVVEEKSSIHPGVKDYTIQSLDGKNLLLLVFDNYEDYHKVSQSNPNGKVNFYKVTFFDASKSKCEISYNFFKSIMKLIYTNGLIKEGQLDTEKVEIFITKNGMRFSELKDRR